MSSAKWFDMAGIQLDGISTLSMTIPPADAKLASGVSGGSGRVIQYQKQFSDEKKTIDFGRAGEVSSTSEKAASGRPHSAIGINGKHCNVCSFCQRR